MDNDVCCRQKQFQDRILIIGLYIYCNELKAIT